MKLISFTAILLVCSFVLSCATLNRPRQLNVRIDETKAVHFMVGDGLVAGHAVIRSGKRPRLLVAFPAGNSGTAVWFEGPDVRFETESPPRVVAGGIEFRVVSHRDNLIVTQAVLGSVRSIRDWEGVRRKPAEIKEARSITSDSTLVIYRKSLDGTSFYRMTLTVEGKVTKLADGRIELKAAEPGKLSMLVRAESGDQALTPLPLADIVKPEYLRRIDPRSAQMLSFLVYKEKFLAGSWTYLTYFGRDTLLTLQLTMKALQPDAIEAILGAVISRLADDGDVAHEEEIGDFASLHSLELGRGPSRRPIYDYKMIDDDFLLPAVLWSYLKNANPNRAKAFLARRMDDGRIYRDAVASNLKFIMAKAKPFAEQPTWRNLVALRPGAQAGQWRDSKEGLGRGRYPYDVNTALVPAALEAAAQIFSSSVFDLQDLERAKQAEKFAGVWNQKAHNYFDVAVASNEVPTRVAAYARHLDLPLPAGFAGAVRFPALALDANGAPIPVMHSDEGFRLLFTAPEPDALIEIADTIIRPFPYGLRSPVGMLVANPAYASPQMQSLFTTTHYHGTVVWSWQQALMAAGLDRQLQRSDLAEPMRAKLKEAERLLWDRIQATQSMKAAELWSWKIENGNMRAVPFGQSANDETEANPNQGWSHAYLVLTPP